MNPLVILARQVVETRSDALPPAVMTATKTFLRDALAVGIAGTRAPLRDRIVETVAGWGRGEEAVVWPSSQRLPAPSAALLTAYQMHALEFDAVHEGAVVHAMTAPAAAALAVLQRHSGIAGRDLLAALALGVEVACIIGLAARSGMRFFRPATAGAFGATATVARLTGLDAETLLHAFGIVYGQISGPMQAHHEGSMMLGLQLAFNARAAVCAVDLARCGVTGPQDILTGPFGYYRLFEPESDVAGAWQELGRTWQVTRLSHKPFPTGRLTHPVVDGLQRLRRGTARPLESIVAVTCRLPPLAMRLVGRPDIPSPDANYARLCLPFVAATTLLRGTVTLADFTPERLSDPAIHAWARKIRLEPDGNADPNAITPQTVAIAYADGAVDVITVRDPIGHPLRPLDDEGQMSKLEQCIAWSGMDLDGHAIAAAVEGLGTAQDCCELIQAITAA